MKVKLIQTGGVVGQQHIGPFDTNDLDPDTRGELEGAVQAVEWDFRSGQNSFPIMYELEVDERHVSWPGNDSPDWASAVAKIIVRLAKWELGG